MPHRQDAASIEVLSLDYQALMAAALEAGADGLGARRAAVVLGRDSASASGVEGARAGLKRLVERGWLAEEKPGRFILPAAAARRTGDGRAVWEADGSVRLDELAAIGLKAPEGPYETVVGLVATRLARIPAKGDELDLGGWRLHVLDVEHHRAEHVRITEPVRVPTQAGEESR